MSRIDVVVTDLDGTLWWGREQVHPTTAEAWSALEERGIPVVVATGRRLSSARNALERLNLQPPAVVLNGALVVDLATERLYHRHYYAIPNALQVLDAFRQHDLEPCVYVDDEHVEVFVGPRPSTHPEHLASFGSTVERADLDEIVATQPVFSFGMMGSEDLQQLRAVVGTLAGVAETHLGPDFYGGHTLTVAPVGLSKWVGVAAYCEHEGLNSERVLAIGDGPNDVELLTHAAVALAPDDAHPEARSGAQHIVASPRDGGWAQLLDFL